jgi:anaerobic magnesium-protoporphyrin IX monomethyl ester cyclase
MKILLATPPSDAASRYGKLAGAGSSQPNLGLLMLAAAVRAAGHQPLLLDAGACGLAWEEALERAMAFAPDVIGLTATTLEVGAAAHFAEALQSRLPAARVVLGGPHVSAVPEETLRRFPVFELAVLGEGEETLCELLAVLAGGGDLATVAGLVWRNGTELCVTGRRPYIVDLDQLPLPAWDLLDGFPRRFSPPAFKTRRLPAASLVTSRGCPNRCIFCDRSVFGASCHGYSADYVVRMIRELYERYGVREIAFEDDTFVTFRPRLLEICRQLIELRLDLSWSCLGRVNQIDAATLALMQQAGCWQISFGIESGSQAILETIRKNVTLAQIRDAVELCRASGIKSKGFFIVGHPGETAETLRQTIALALELPLDDLSVTMLTPFPGTELHARAAEFGSFDADWMKMNLLNAVFVPQGLTAADLEAAQRELLRRFYLRPRIIVDYAARLARNPALFLALLRGFRAWLRSI